MSSYNFLKDSGVSETAKATGHTEQKLFNSGDSLFSGIGLIINSVLGLVGIIFLVLLLYGGFLWMTSQGDDSQVEKSKNIIKSAIIGLVITLSAFAISFFVLKSFGGNLTV